MTVSLLIIIAAVILDLFIGDPRTFPHITRACGYVISKYESLLYQKREFHL